MRTIATEHKVRELHGQPVGLHQSQLGKQSPTLLNVVATQSHEKEGDKIVFQLVLLLSPIQDCHILSSNGNDRSQLSLEQGEAQRQALHENVQKLFQWLFQRRCLPLWPQEVSRQWRWT